MSFRVPALVAVLVAGSAAPAFAQPQAPPRPRSSPFGNVFTPEPAALAPQGQGIFGFNQPGVAPALGVPNTPFFLYPGQTAYPQALPGAYGAVSPQLAPTGVVGTFNNLGHWYGGRTGYYGHWYPNGVANGSGILTGGGGGAYAGSAGAFAPTVGGAGVSRPAGGSALGTGLMAGAAINQFRR